MRPFPGIAMSPTAPSSINLSQCPAPPKSGDFRTPNPIFGGLDIFETPTRVGSSCRISCPNPSPARPSDTNGLLFAQFFSVGRNRRNASLPSPIPADSDQRQRPAAIGNNLPANARRGWHPPSPSLQSTSQAQSPPHSLEKCIRNIHVTSNTLTLLTSTPANHRRATS